MTNDRQIPISHVVSVHHCIDPASQPAQPASSFSHVHLLPLTFRAAIPAGHAGVTLCPPGYCLYSL